MTFLCNQAMKLYNLALIKVRCQCDHVFKQLKAVNNWLDAAVRLRFKKQIIPHAVQ